MRTDNTQDEYKHFVVRYLCQIEKLTQKEIKHNGPTRSFVYDYTSGDITATFYTDKFMRERTFFEIWQKAAFSNTTHNFNYYDNYVAPIDIYGVRSVLLVEMKEMM